MRARIACLPGGGAGPEVMAEAVRVLTSVACAFGHSFVFVEEKIGLPAFAAYGTPLSEKALEACKSADAVLLGAFPQPFSEGGEAAQGFPLLVERLGLYAGLQRCVIPPASAGLSPLKEQAGSADLLLVRLLPPSPAPMAEGEAPLDTVSLPAPPTEQAVRLAFRKARERHRRLACVLLPELGITARIFEETVLRAAKDFPDVLCSFQPAGRCAAELIQSPEKLDVVLCGPLAGDPLSGLLAGLAGGLGLAHMQLCGDQKPALYLPIQGEEAHLAGRDTANPIGMILCAAEMLKASLHLNREADCLEMAVKNVLDSGWRTADMARGGAPRVGTEAIGKLIAEQVDTAGAIMGALRG